MRWLNLLALFVALWQAPGAVTNPQLSILHNVIAVPTSAETYDAGTNATLATLSGTATGSHPILACTWSNSLGGSGTVTGTTSWSVSSIALTVGSNVLTVTCINDQGLSKSDVLTVTRSADTCTTTLSPGATIQTTLNSIASGSTICLNSGNYGTQTLTAQKSSMTIVRSTTGQGAVGNFNLSDAQFVSIRSVTFNGGGSISGSATDNVEIRDSDFQTNGVQLDLQLSGMTSTNDILVDGNTFGGWVSDGFEGTIMILRNPTTGSNVPAIISNNIFEGGSCADGIQSTNNASGFTIGPGNLFRNWIQGACEPHVDAFQIVDGFNITVTGNYFINNTIYFGFYDGSQDITVTQNVFDAANGTGQVFQMGGIVGMTMSHNTFKGGYQVAAGSKTGDPPNSGWVIENNIFDDVDFIASGDQPGCGSDCVMRYNLKSNGSTTDPTGTNNVTGTAVYLGSLSYVNWANWQLDAGSPGENAGNDGFDMGTRCYGRGVGTCN